MDRGRVAEAKKTSWCGSSMMWSSISSNGGVEFREQSCLYRNTARCTVGFTYQRVPIIYSGLPATAAGRASQGHPIGGGFIKVFGLSTTFCSSGTNCCGFMWLRAGHRHPAKRHATRFRADPPLVSSSRACSKQHYRSRHTRLPIRLLTFLVKAVSFFPKNRLARPLVASDQFIALPYAAGLRAAASSG